MSIDHVKGSPIDLYKGIAHEVVGNTELKTVVTKTDKDFCPINCIHVSTLSQRQKII